MRKLMVLLTVLCAVSFTQAAATGSVLFSDNYNRPNNTNISASTVGMAGTLSPLTYVEAFEGSGVATSIQVLSSQLNVAVGAGMSSLFLDHNFTDAAMLTADGFSISMDVASITSADDVGNRFGGFGVGNTRAEAQAAADSFDSPAPFRPNLARANTGIGVSDFYVDLALDQNLRLWSNGDLLNTINVGAVAGTIRADFLFSDFNTGTVVTVIVYFNGVQQDAQTFTWDNTGANYIGISGRTAGAGVFLDNLSISTIYDDRANLPDPANGQMLVEAEGLILSWNKGKDASGNPNAAIGQHYLYIAESEPNFVDAPLTVADTADPVTYGSYSFENDKLYYWRVDESINNSGAADANTIVGHVWSFDTFTFPIINTDPGQAIAAPTETAALTCVFTSVTEPTVAWFKEAGETDVEMIAGGDVTIDLSNPAGNSYLSTLTIAGIEVSDEGAYYCLIENASGSENAVASATGSVGVKRQVAHWTLNNDVNGYNNGQYVDLSGEGHNADPNLPPVFTTDTPGSIGGQAVDLTSATGQPLAAADSNDWAPSMYTGQVTVSAWLNWAGTNGSWQGVISNRVAAPPAIHNFYIEIRQDNGRLQIGGIPGVGDLSIAPLPVGEWVHLAITARAGQVLIYLNGEVLASNTAGQAVTQNIAPLYVGALGRNALGRLINTFNGKMDDIQIYNEALSGTQVVDLYYDVMETPVCLNPLGRDLSFDVAGGGLLGDQPDCIVGLADFAEFARDWLNCGLYPQADCQ